MTEDDVFRRAYDATEGKDTITLLRELTARSAVREYRLDQVEGEVESIKADVSDLKAQAPSPDDLQKMRDFINLFSDLRQRGKGALWAGGVVLVLIGALLFSREKFAEAVAAFGHWLGGNK
jgi:hypothetical protein